MRHIVGHLPLRRGRSLHRPAGEFPEQSVRPAARARRAARLTIGGQGHI